jgi:hypothetical protein
MAEGMTPSANFSPISEMQINKGLGRHFNHTFELEDWTLLEV